MLMINLLLTWDCGSCYNELFLVQGKDMTKVYIWHVVQQEIRLMALHKHLYLQREKLTPHFNWKKKNGETIVTLMSSWQISRTRVYKFNCRFWRNRNGKNWKLCSRQRVVNLLFIVIVSSSQNQRHDDCPKGNKCHDLTSYKHNQDTGEYHGASYSSSLLGKKKKKRKNIQLGKIQQKRT